MMSLVQADTAGSTPKRLCWTFAAMARCLLGAVGRTWHETSFTHAAEAIAHLSDLRRQIAVEAAQQQQFGECVIRQSQRAL